MRLKLIHPLLPAALVISAAFPTAHAQENVPRAQQVDENETLTADPGQDWFEHGRNLFTAAEKEGDINLRLEQYQRAIEVLTRYLTDYPNHPNAEAAWWYLGKSYYASGQAEDARRCFHSLISRFKKGRYAAAATYTIAAEYFNNREYALSASMFDQLASMAETPLDRQRGLYHAGLSYELLGRDREARRFYENLVKDTDPNNPFLSKAQLSLGKILAKDGKNQEAIALLDQVVNSKATPDLRGQAAVEAGSLAAKTGDIAKSEQYLSLVLKTPGMEASRGVAQLAMMASRFDQKNYKEVVSIYQINAEKLEGENEARRQMLAARAYMLLGQNAEALQAFREVEKLQLEDDSYAFEASYLRLLCFYRIEGHHVPEQVDAFIQVYREKHPQDPKMHTALLMKAESLLAAKNVKDAVKVYADINAALISKENRAGYLYNYGWCQANTDNQPGAIRSMTSFIKDFPQDKRVAQAYTLRAKAYYDSGDLIHAKQDYDTILSNAEWKQYQGDALLESADICRQQNDFQDMIRRYQSYLDTAKSGDATLTAKAHYWTAWGLVKLEKAKEAVPHAEEARKQLPSVYNKNAGALICLSWWAQQNPEKTREEVDTAIKNGYADTLPERLIRWAAMQSFNIGDYTQAARFYTLITNFEEPGATPKEVWRYLGKSLLESGKAKEALRAINQALSQEVDASWRADGLLDKARAELALDQLAEAEATINEGLKLRPQGRIGAGLNIARGDLHMKQAKPSEAVQDYVGTVELMDDNDRAMKPEAIYKLIKALEQSNQPESAESYRTKLRTTYPDWTPPAAKP
jgi:tetratricopeptide (TPR) repeat protein